jgi:hypothetical protein
MLCMKIIHSLSLFTCIAMRVIHGDMRIKERILIDLCNELGYNYFVGNKWSHIEVFSNMLEVSCYDLWTYVGIYE